MSVNGTDPDLPRPAVGPGVLQQREDLQRLHELSTQLHETADLAVQLRLILLALVELHEAGSGLLSLCAPDTGAPLQVRCSSGFSVADVAHWTSLPRFSCGLATRHRRRTVVEDTETDPGFAACREFARAHGFRAVHSTPMVGTRAEVMGVMTVFLRTPRAPTARECALADICARKAAVFTERARAWDETLHFRGRFEQVLEASAAPFVMLQPVHGDGVIADFTWTYVNRAAARMIGRAQRVLTGRRALATLPAAWRDSTAFWCCVAAVETQQAVRFDTVVPASGPPRWFHCIASPVRDGIAIWFTDISERIRDEQMLRNSDRLKDEFLATLAHELRNPLAPIRLAAQLARAPGATDEHKRWASEVISRQVEHMAALLDDLIDVSRITRGTLPIRKSTTDLDSVIASAIETAHPLINSQGHAFDVCISNPPLVLHADALRLAQVVANLLTNAAKFTPPNGAIRLDARCENGEMVVEVRDNGMGFAPEAAEDIFRMFTQLRPTADRTGGGLGIGLALSRRLVELHGGTLTAHSAGPGEGSVFTVRLPSEPALALAPAAAPADTAPVAVARRHRVLIADDNRDASGTLAELLTLSGHEVHQADDGGQALALWQRFHHEICLLDIGMPGLTGYQLARAIRASPGGALCLLVAVTGWGQAHDREEALAAGFDIHLTKPVDVVQIERLLAQR